MSVESAQTQVHRRADAVPAQRHARPQSLSMKVDGERARLVKLAANPLANRGWGVYQRPLEQNSKTYLASGGSTRALLSKIALRPDSERFSMWVGPSEPVIACGAKTPSALLHTSIIHSLGRAADWPPGNPSAADAMAAHRRPAGESAGDRGRLPLGRATLALPPQQPVRHGPRTLTGAVHAVLRRSS